MNIRELNQRLNAARDCYIQLKTKLQSLEQASSSIAASWHNIKRVAEENELDVCGISTGIIVPFQNELNEQIEQLKKQTKIAKDMWKELNDSYQAEREQIEAERKAEAERIEREKTEQLMNSLSTEQLLELARKRGLLV